LSKIEFFQPRNFARSTDGFAKVIPRAGLASIASRISSVACSSAFDGMQPWFKHTPPNRASVSTSRTVRPRSAA
jgi:hypothetical protein